MKSPKPPKVEPKEMDFADALTQVLMGKSITKKEWGNIQIYGILDNEILRLHKSDGKLYDWIISEADLRGDDWVVI